MKICSKCKIEKEFESFYRVPKKETYRSICKLCLNIKSKNYYIDNKDELIEYKKKWRDNNIDIILQKDKIKRDSLSSNDKLSIKEYNKVWQDNNKDDQKTKKAEYYLKNKDIFLIKSKQYRDDNKEKISEYKKNNKHIRNKRRNERLKVDPLYALEKSIRNNIYNCFKRNNYMKKSRTHEILGCSFIEFKIYLESKFENWMSWENRGLYNNELNYGWDLDHIIPISSAKTEEEVIKLNHYTNLQPLCSYINRNIKRDIYIDIYIS